MVPDHAERRDVPRETNPLVVFLAELGVALAGREREAVERAETEAVEGPDDAPAVAENDHAGDRS